ncbi:MAG: amidohydrolase [Clostridia bacterium]|nr:amidohydrolase [Clostridia bacterium]
MERLKQLCKNVEKHRQLIFDAHDYIWEHAESGFREWETAAYLTAAYEKLGYTLVQAGNIPGFYTDIDTGRPGPRLLIMGEMDSLIIPAHPEARKDTGCVHACGHHCQSAALLGVAAALKEPGALDGLSGSIRLMAVPAEEVVEFEWRDEMRKQGVIRYFGGKQEFLSRGYMEGCDLAFIVHTSYGEGDFEAPNLGDNGCVFKNATFLGKAAHAGFAPYRGINALYAANLAMNAINALRETFREEDYVRTHPIVTKGGSVPNAIPSVVTVENQVRASNMAAILATNEKVNRAMAGAAAAMGAGLKITDRAGYAPLQNNRRMSELFCRAANLLCPDHPIETVETWSTGCTDMGDVSCLMPALHPYCIGAAGPAHSDDYRIESVEKACVNSAKVQLAMLELLLENGAAEAKAIVENYKPVYNSVAEYMADLDRLMLDKDAVQMNEDGTITLNYKE